MERLQKYDELSADEKESQVKVTLRSLTEL